MNMTHGKNISVCRHSDYRTEKVVCVRESETAQGLGIRREDGALVPGKWNRNER